MSWDRLFQGELSSSHLPHCVSQERWRPCPVVCSESCFLLCTGQEKPWGFVSGTCCEGLLPELVRVPVALLPARGPGGECRWLARTNCSWPGPGRAAGAQLEGDHRLAPCPPCQQGPIALAWAPVLAEKVTLSITQVWTAVEQDIELGNPLSHSAVPFWAVQGRFGTWLEEVWLQQEPEAQQGMG